jgi:hypothetical protein
VHAVEVAVADYKDDVLGPVRIFCGPNSGHKTQTWNEIYRRFKNAAKESTVATPLTLSSPVRLFQEALMTIASIPDVLGAEKTA